MRAFALIYGGLVLSILFQPDWASAAVPRIPLSGVENSGTCGGLFDGSKGFRFKYSTEAESRRHIETAEKIVALLRDGKTNTVTAITEGTVEQLALQALEDEVFSMKVSAVSGLSQSSMEIFKANAAFQRRLGTFVPAQGNGLIARAARALGPSAEKLAARFQTARESLKASIQGMRAKEQEASRYVESIKNGRTRSIEIAEAIMKRNEVRMFYVQYMKDFVDNLEGQGGYEVESTVLDSKYLAGQLRVRLIEPLLGIIAGDEERAAILSQLADSDDQMIRLAERAKIEIGKAATTFGIVMPTVVQKNLVLAGVENSLRMADESRALIKKGLDEIRSAAKRTSDLAIEAQQKSIVGAEGLSAWSKSMAHVSDELYQSTLSNIPKLEAKIGQFREVTTRNMTAVRGAIITDQAVAQVMGELRELSSDGQPLKRR